MKLGYPKEEIWKCQMYTQQIPEQKIYWKIFYHKFTDQVDHKFMENLTKNI